MITRCLLLFSTIILLQACGDSDDNFFGGGGEPAPDVFAAEIIWTEYGIPHITADDWGGLGYGFGYAYAQENFCVTMKEYIYANSESARYLGDDGDLDSDFAYKLFNSEEAIDRMIASLPERTIELGEGYVAGLNRYLEETGADGLAEGDEGCRGAEWAKPVTLRGMVALWHKRILLASGDALKNFIVAAEPSATVTAVSPLQRQQMLARLSPQSLARGMDLPEPAQIGSNAYAIGGETTATGTGILFGNPHFPWQGTNRFFMSHLTIPDVYDISGAALHGVPLIMIGFTQNLAWSHTVSTGQRFTFYELTLNPDNPLEYLYDGEMRTIEPLIVSVETLNDEGEVVTAEHTFYMTHFGPMVDLGGVEPLLSGWPNILGTAFAYRDANLDNLRVFDQFLNMAQAADMEEFAAAHEVMGIPWVNTIASDRFGDALYADLSVVPHVSQNKLNNCVQGIVAESLTAANFTTLSGSNILCEWGGDEGAPEGIFGYDSMPKLPTRGYGANANDSYWLSNPRQLLEGFSPIIGGEGIEQSLRTRLTFVQAEERLAGSDGLGPAGFSKESVKQISYGARNLAEELLRVEVVFQCSAVTDWSVYTGNTAAAAEACALLGNWDGRHTIDSTGGHIFYEFWKEARSIPDLWAVPFDAADPVNTPNTLNDGDSGVVDAVLQALASGVDALVDAGIALDQPWGDVQFVEKNGVRIPIHGGSGSMLFSVITSDLVDGEGYSNIVHGNSYMQTVTWDESDCPDADAMLTYSQSTDPASDHYADATELYSQGGWIDMAFCEADIEAAEIRRESISEEVSSAGG